MRQHTVSVAMAVYNGQQYIKEQVDSILKQLEEKDELVISLDPSTDQTEDILKSYKDSRMKVLNGPGQGLLKNFENAISNCKNDYIFLSDQDDIWLDGKVDQVSKELDKGYMVVLHDAKIVDEHLNEVAPSFLEHRKSRTGMTKNIIKNSYIGCCMAFRKELKDSILPFPSNIPMHDQWIGLVGEKKGSNKIVKEPLILYRRHEDNVSDMQHSGVIQMIKWRFAILSAILKVRK